MSHRHVLILFLDGVGLGSSDPARNPFCAARMPTLQGLLGDGWFLRERGAISARHASLAPTDACLGVEGRPQSATGQASLLTGLNVAAEVGQHYGPKPTRRIAALVRGGNLFRCVVGAGGTAAFLNPYPPRFFEAIENGRRLLSVIPLAAMSAGLRLRTHEDLTAGRAISPDFTGQAWRDRLNLPETPVIGRRAAGARLAKLSTEAALTLLEHWPTDLIGHRQDYGQAVEALETLDAVLAGLLDVWDWSSGLALITSDHGNLEDLAVRSHTLNPVPTILIGWKHAELAAQVRDLTDVAPAVSRFLTGQECRASGLPRSGAL
jgi:2,3-bisphosphoglycerate-independent phosphoglycerate mutase